jgi:L-cysteine/cystine lyase
MWGLDWRPGDEAITTSIEHGGVLLPLRQVGQRKGVTVRVAEVGAGSSQTALEAIQALLTPRTRLVALSHVSYSTGACLPIERIAEIAHSAGAEVLVDGAQAVGAIPVDVHALGVDYYAYSGQKWLCGPEGTGGLYVRRDRQEQLKPTYVGMRSAGAGAIRYEYATLFRPGVHGLHAALGWLDELGRETVFQRTAQLTAYCYERLAALPGVENLTPWNARAGLVHARIPGADLNECVAFLQERRVTIRLVPDTSALRVSCAFFNTPDDVDRLVDSIKAFQRSC